MTPRADEEIDVIFEANELAFDIVDETKLENISFGLPVGGGTERRGGLSVTVGGGI